jgi:hypothetical protein
MADLDRREQLMAAMEASEEGELEPVEDVSLEVEPVDDIAEEAQAEEKVEFAKEEEMEAPPIIPALHFFTWGSKFFSISCSKVLGTPHR